MTLRNSIANHPCYCETFTSDIHEMYTRTTVSKLKNLLGLSNPNDAIFQVPLVETNNVGTSKLISERGGTKYSPNTGDHLALRFNSKLRRKIWRNPRLVCWKNNPINMYLYLLDFLRYVEYATVQSQNVDTSIPHTISYLPPTWVPAPVGQHRENLFWLFSRKGKFMFDIM